VKSAERDVIAAGMMVEGKWTTNWNRSDASGKFIPKPTTFRDQVTADGSSGFKAAVGRYHLYVALAMSQIFDFKGS
jgi:glutathionyl-hydroquinone reductase